MVDNSAAKNHLNTVEATLNDITKPEPISTSIAKNSLDLFRNLSSKNLFIDNDILRSLKDVRTALANLNAQAVNRETYLDGVIGGIPAGPGGASTRANLTNEKGFVHNIHTSPNRGNRFNEYDRLVTYAEYFRIGGPGSNLDELDIKTTDVLASPRHTIALDNVFKNNPGDPTPAYILCDELGNEIGRIKPTLSNYKLNIGGQEYTLGGIRNNGGNLDCSGLTITPALKNSPQEITLSITAIFDSSTVNVRDVNVACNKKFKLKLNDGTLPLRDSARLIEFNRYNDSLPAGHKIENIIETNFNGNRYNLERSALAKILEKNGGAKYATLNNNQKEALYQRIRHIEPVPDVQYFDNLLAFEHINTDILRFNEFRNWFIHNDRDWNKGDNIKSDSNYITFIHNNVSEKFGEFISSKLDNYLGNIAQETLLKSELTSFINEIENNKLDNDTTIYSDINDYASHTSHQMDRKKHWYNIGRDSDSNYMRFFTGSSASLHGETINIHTNTDAESTSTAEPLKYDMDVKVSGKNNIEVEIKIEGESNPIRIKSGEPAALVRKIMRDCRIKYGKARAHMSFNIYKAMVKMAKDNDISLQYRLNTGARQTRYIDINDGNILIRETDNLVRLGRGEGRVIFDQKGFMDSNQFGNYDDITSLRRGVDMLGSHFTLAMNQLHKQYRHGIEKKFGTLFNSRSKMSFPTSFWSSPIKKLLNIRNSTNFDFDTTIRSKGKNVSVEFKKNKFTINMDGLERPIESKDLGKILNARQKGIRIFDGIERNIVEGIYAILIAKLRENRKIANTDFGVMDNITGNMYVLDIDGRFGVIAMENLSSEGNPLGSGEYGRLNHNRLDRNTVDWFEHGSSEERELMKNPFLMQRFVKAMNRRLGQR